jgi:hypothetical protein
MYLDVFIFACRMKVDLTKYIEQHSFTFDDVFDSDETNEKVHTYITSLYFTRNNMNRYTRELLNH